MKTGLDIISAVFLGVFVFLFSGCNAKDGGPKAPGVSFFVVYSHSPGSSYLIYINGEPVGWAMGTDDYMVRGFPIHRGTNVAVVKAEFLPEWVDIMPRYYSATVSMRLCTQETTGGSLSSRNWNTIDAFNDPWTTNKPYENEWEFEMKNSVPNYDFEELGLNKEVDVQQCRSMAVKLASLIQRQESDSLAKVFGLTNFDGFAGDPVRSGVAASVRTRLLMNCPDLCPRLIFPDYAITNKDVSVSGITNESDVLTQTGPHLLLLYCKNNHHFASFANNKLIAMTSILKSAPFEHYGIINIDSFVFARAHGKWKFTAKGCGWLNFDERILDAAGPAK